MKKFYNVIVSSFLVSTTWRNTFICVFRAMQSRFGVEDFYVGVINLSVGLVK